MNNFRSGWSLIYTKPRHEKKAHEWLSELTIHSFLPIKGWNMSWASSIASYLGIPAVIREDPS
jgi:hypothetical protein